MLNFYLHQALQVFINIIPACIVAGFPQKNLKWVIISVVFN